MIDDNPILSIIIPTYGHEKYISQALDSVLMQKTKYRYEILVGEDASPDGTREILKQYERKFPDIFRMIYREENLYKQGLSNSIDLSHRAKGKYLIILEGDDFWIDEYKIEKQIDFLEKHPEYVATSHNCLVVNEDSMPNGEEYPECKHSEYSLNDFLNDIMPGQLATLMLRNYCKTPFFNTSILEKNLSPRDRLIYFALIANGKIYCVQEKMTAYRHVKSNGTSFSANYKFDYIREERWHHELLSYSRMINNKEAIKVAEALYFSINYRAYKGKHISFLRFIKNIKEVNIFSSIIGLLRRKRYKSKHKVNFDA